MIVMISSTDESATLAELEYIVHEAQTTFANHPVKFSLSFDTSDPVPLIDLD